MRSESKMDQSPSSTLRTDENSSSFTELPSFINQPFKRFTRSNSRSRSKSREDPKEEIFSKFFIKNICSQATNTSEKTQHALNRLVRTQDRNGKRQDTPVKSRKQVIQPNTHDTTHESSLEKQLEWLKLQRKCQQAEAENLKLHQLNKVLEDRLNQLSIQMSEVLHQRLFFEEKVRYYEQKEKKEPRQRSNNLVKLKREIAKQKEIDGSPPIELLQQQLDVANSELQILRESLSWSEKLRKQAVSYAQSHKSERQTFLEDLVQQLKSDLSEKDELIDKIKIQLNIFLIRQAKQQDRVQMLKNQELINLKRKYGNVLKKYHEATQEIASFKRKQQRFSDLFAPRSLRQVDNSLSLSP